MKSISIQKIIVHAIPGSSFDICLNEAVELAFKHNEDVELTHNDSIYVISPNKIKKAIINDYEA